MKKQLLLLFAISALATTVSAQVMVEKQIQMTGTTAGDRRITNVGMAVDSADAVNAATVQRGTLTYATATGVANAYAVTLPVNAGNYTTGMIVSFRANAANTGSITLNVNGWGAKNVFQNVSTPLVAGDILADQIVTVIYDGTNFQTASAMAQTINFTGTLSGDVSGTQHATVIEPAAVTTPKIADGAVTTTKIIDDAVTTSKILNANVTNAKIADDAVTTSKILNANVTTAKIADANVTTPKLADASVTTNKLVDLNVTTPKLADNSVTIAKMATTGTLPAFNGSNLTNLTAANITGTNSLPVGVLPTSVTLQGNTFNGNNQLVQTNGTGQIPATALPAHTGDVTSTAGSAVLSIANNATAGTNIVNAANNAGTTGTWVAARMPAHTGDVTSTAGSVALSIANTATSGTNIVAAVNNGGATGTITPARLGTGTPGVTNYLRGDGSWQVVNGLTAGSAPGQLYLTGTGGSVPTTPVTMTGDVAITSTGVTSITNNATSGNNIVTALNSANTGTIPAARVAGTVGNAATATALQTARNINGVSFNGTADITVPAAAGTLTGTTLNATVVNSSLTSVGTLTNLTVTNPIAGSVTGNAATATTLQTARNINGVSFNGTADITVPAAAGTLTGATLNSTVTNSSLTSVGTLTNLTVTNPIAGNITGNAATVTTNANMTGDVTSIGNATTIANNATSGNNIITALNSATTGTVPPARLGTGTTSSTNVLHGNGTWAPAFTPAYAQVANNFPQAVAQEGDVIFSIAYTATPGITFIPGTAQVIVNVPGTYRITWSVSAVEPNQFSVYRSGLEVPGAIRGTSTGNVVNSGFCITAITSGDIITLRNHTSATPTVTLTNFNGGLQADITASLMLEKIAD